MGSTAPLRVLVVEDDELFAAFLRSVLASGAEPMDVHHVADLGAALVRLRRSIPDAVVLDLHLADSHGLSTLTAVLEAAPHLPVVVLTGSEGTSTAREALRLGAQDWLVKGTLDPDLVQRALRYAVERKRLTDRLVQAEKLEFAGRLAHSVAHEFNNVLTAFAGGLSLLDEAEDSASRESALEFLRRATRQGAALSQQLLSLSRTPPTRLVRLSARTLVANAAVLVQAVIPPAVRLEMLPMPDVLVEVDPDHFDQVLLNLALNAKDAMPDGGTLRLGGDVETDSQAGQRFALIRVSDTGTGIEPAVLSRLFEPFFTAKGSRGTGLGLAASEELVRRFGGRITVESRPGAGTTFTVALPVVT